MVPCKGEMQMTDLMLCQFTVYQQKVSGEDLGEECPWHTLTSLHRPPQGTMHRPLFMSILLCPVIPQPCSPPNKPFGHLCLIRFLCLSQGRCQAMLCVSKLDVSLIALFIINNSCDLALSYHSIVWLLFGQKHQYLFRLKYPRYRHE